MTDIRNIRTGRTIPTETYSDQPYIVKTADGAWLCVVTTGAGREGQSGQHVVTVRSSDEGRTWSAPVDVEPADGPEASYAVLNTVGFSAYLHGSGYDLDQFLQELKAAGEYIKSQSE